MGKATERLFLPLLKLMIPEIIDMNLPLFGVFHNFVFLSIDKRYPFQAKRGNAWDMGHGADDVHEDYCGGG